MGNSKNKSFLRNFLGNTKQYPVLAALAAGLYPLLFYYSRNFSLIDSWSHLGYFLMVFLLIPIIIFKLFDWINKRLPSRWGKYVLPFLNLFVFLFFLKLILYPGIQKKIIMGIIVLSGLAAFYLNRYFKKWVTFQLILAVIGVFTFVPELLRAVDYSDAWMKQPDTIEGALFKKKPNVYYIQPDGYANFSELKKGYYNFDDSDFEHFLVKNNFKNYQGFRSNYDATLASNSATFAMKHHLYSGSTRSSEVTRARNIIISDNAVLNIFKANGYKTYFFTEFPYLLMNRPKMGYDYSNFDYSDVPFLGTGLENKKDVLPDLKKILAQKDVSQPRFCFIEIFNPKHIDGSTVGKNLVSKKRNEYLENIQKANTTVKGIVENILQNDPQALILIMADHGGYVGMRSLHQGNEKTEDRDKIFSMFSSMLSIHWPNAKAPEYDDRFKTAINVFRILFSYLSENTSYLDHLQDDISYGLIFKGAPDGVYELIDEKDSLVFKTVRLLRDK